MTTPAESNPYASPNEATGTPFDPGGGNRATVDNPDIIRALSGTRPWVFLVGILGMIVTGLLGLGALANVFSALGTALVWIGILNSLGFLLVAAVCLATSLYLLSYGRRISNFLRSRDRADLAASLMVQKSFWKLAGILFLVFLLMIPIVLLLGFG